MGTTVFNFFVVVRWLLLLSACKVSAQHCEYRRDLIAGQEYHISSPSYPNEYRPGTRCLWDLRTAIGTKIYLSCTIELPASPNCNANHLAISSTGNRQFTDAEVHCGSKSFSVFSKATDMTIGLFTTPQSEGGRFLCVATNMKNSNPAASIGQSEQQSCDCSSSQTARIVGGVETGVNEFPYMAAVVSSGALLCGANIISDKFSLTAAHCVFARNPTNLFLLVGDHNITTGEDTAHTALYKIRAYELHPDYDQSNQKNDIAILQSETQIIFGASVAPVCLPFRYTFESFDGQPVVILGWGQLEFTGPTSETLQKALVYILPRTQCSVMQNEPITAGDICTFSKDQRDSCQSDSGGPVLWYDTAIQRYLLIGIISRGVGCASNSPSVNTRVSEYLQWIVTRTRTNYCIK